MLLGREFPKDLSEEDIRYLFYLGLIELKNGQIDIANGIYREVIPRALIYSTQLLIRYNLSWYMADDGSLNIRTMLKSFQKFFRKHFIHWVKRFSYAEAGAPLLLQAFLQRILDGGGRIERSYGLGRGYITLLLYWPYKRKTQKTIIDIWYLKGSLKDTIKKGVEELAKNLAANKILNGHLVLFDNKRDEFWEQKVSTTKIGKDSHIDIWKI